MKLQNVYRLICIKNNVNSFLGFSNAAFIFFTFLHLLDFTFSHLLDFTFSHLLDFTFSHLSDNSIIGFYIFTSFGFLNFCILHFSLLSFLLWKILIDLMHFSGALMRSCQYVYVFVYLHINSAAPRLLLEGNPGTVYISFC